MSHTKKRKPFWKPNKIFKLIRKRQRRSHDNQLIRMGMEPLKQPKNDVWEWN